MIQRGGFILGLCAVAVVVGASIVAQRVGGIRVRTLGQDVPAVQLVFADHPLAGAPLLVRWEGGAVDGEYEVELALHTAQDEYVLMIGRWQERQLWVTLPCGDPGAASLVLRTAGTRSLLAVAALTIPSDTAECFYMSRK